MLRGSSQVYLRYRNLLIRTSCFSTWARYSIGANTQHIRVLQAFADPLWQHLSTEDFYLDSTTLLPLAITFQVHPDLDAATDIPAEVDFANYQPVSGVLVPFHIQRQLNGGVVLDLTVGSAAFNTGLTVTTFNLP